MKTTILTSRPIGNLCYEWALQNCPERWEIHIARDHSSVDLGDVVFSVQYEKILTDFSPGVRYYNFHPAILPQYAGTSCLSWVIINEEQESGITLHELVAEIDAGDIVDIRRFPLNNTETAESLSSKTNEELFTMFKSWFATLLLEKPQATAQNKNIRRVYKRKDLDQQKDLTRFVRALTFRGKENSFFTTRDGRKFQLDYENGVTEIR